VDLTASRPRLLRPGGLAVELIEAVLGTQLDIHTETRAGPQMAPGLMPRHYAPRTPLVMLLGEPARARARLQHEVELAVASGQRVGVLLLEEDRSLFDSAIDVAHLGRWDDPEASAVLLFDALRTLDRARLDVLFARQLADDRSGIGRALADRLRRAAVRVIYA
jgi:L-threonylcarbamoyladenylate synthase